MQYKEAWSYLDRLQFFKIKLGLDSMAAFLAKVANPERNLKFIHVAGTNGKGSVAVTLLTILSEAGYKVGLYTSPHLSCVRERFRINDRFISESDFAETASIIRDSLGGKEITYFEFTTALALLWFAGQNVDIVILEVGLGGRLDATNVITPLISIITNVSMDHEAHLGTTLELIAVEKAGIVKKGIPVVAGVGEGAGRDVVIRTCREKDSPLYLLGRDFEAVGQGNGFWNYYGPGARTLPHLRLAMRGAHQLDNAAIALATVDLLRQKEFPVNDDAVRSSLAVVRWPGRLEYFCLDRTDGRLVDCPTEPRTPGNNGFRRYLLDGAHNPDGVLSLTRSLQTGFSYGRLICVWASMADKDIKKTLDCMAPLCHRIIFTRPETVRSATAETLRNSLPDTLRNRATAAATVEDALSRAAEEAGPDDLICVAGSLYLVGAARKILLGEIVGGNGKRKE